MPVFTPNFPRVAAPDYLGYASPPSSFTIPEDKTAGVLLSGFAKLLDVGLTGLTSSIGLAAKEETAKAFETTAEKHGGILLSPEETAELSGISKRGRWTPAPGLTPEGPPAASEGPGFPAPTPAAPPALQEELQTKLSRVEKLRAQKLAGMLSDAQFETELAVVVSNLKSRWRGFEDVIDQEISRLRGTSSANILRKQHLQALDQWAAAQQSAMKEIDSRLDKYMDSFLAATKKIDPQTGQPTWIYPDGKGGFVDVSSRDWMRANIDRVSEVAGRYDGLVKHTEVQLKNFSLQESALKNTAQNARMTMRAILANNLQAVWDQTSFGAGRAGLSLDDISKLIARHAATGAFGPQETAAMTLRLQQLETQVEQMLLRAFDTPIPDEKGQPTGKTFRQLMDPEDIKKEVEMAMAPIRSLKQAIIDKDAGFTAVAANLVKHYRSLAQSDILKNPQMSRLIGLNDLVNSQTLLYALQHNKTVANGYLNALESLWAADIANKGSPTPPMKVDEHVTKNIQQGDPSRPVPADTLKNLDNIAKAGAMDKDPAIVKRSVEAYYDSLEYFRKAPSLQRFRQMASPEVSRHVYETLGKTDPEAYQKYQMWVEKSFLLLARPLFNTVGRMDNAVLRWDPDRGQVVVEWVNKPKLFQHQHEQLRPVDELNTALQMLRPLYEAQGVNPNEAIFKLLQHAIPFDKMPEPPKPLWPMIQDMYNSVGEKIKSVYDNLADYFTPGTGLTRGLSPQTTVTREVPAATPDTVTSPEAPETGPIGTAPVPPPRAEPPRGTAPLRDEGATVEPMRFDPTRRGPEVQPAPGAVTSPASTPSRAPAPERRASAAEINKRAGEPVENITGPIPGAKDLVIQPIKTSTEIASKYLGINEKEHAGVIKEFIKTTIGKDTGLAPWCAAFVNSVLKEQGIEGTGSLAARSFLTRGTPVSDPKKGDVVVLSRGSDPTKGHVGFYVGPGEKEGYIKVLGGNQNDAVSIKEFPVERVLGYRRFTPRQILGEAPTEARTQLASLTTDGNVTPRYRKAQEDRRMIEDARNEAELPSAIGILIDVLSDPDTYTRLGFSPEDAAQLKKQLEKILLPATVPVRRRYPDGTIIDEPGVL